jgi:DNA-binding NarL/FixJ family response regulator
LQDIVALSPDACIFNLGSRDTLIRVSELTLTGQRAFVFGESTTIARDSTVPIGSQNDNDEVDAAKGSAGNASYRRGTEGQAELSARERDVLTCLAQGKSNKAIARLYNLSEATVKVHLKAILRKTKAHNRTQAAIWAIKHRLRDGSGNVVADAPSLRPPGATPISEYECGCGVISASRDNGLPPEPPSTRHPDSDRLPRR